MIVPFRGSGGLDDRPPMPHPRACKVNRQAVVAVMGATMDPQA